MEQTMTFKETLIHGFQLDYIPEDVNDLPECARKYADNDRAIKIFMRSFHRGERIGAALALLDIIVQLIAEGADLEEVQRYFHMSEDEYERLAYFFDGVNIIAVPDQDDANADENVLKRGMVVLKADNLKEKIEKEAEICNKFCANASFLDGYKIGAARAVVETLIRMVAHDVSTDTIFEVFPKLTQEELERITYFFDFEDEED